MVEEEDGVREESREKYKLNQNNWKKEKEHQLLLVKHTSLQLTRKLFNVL